MKDFYLELDKKAIKALLNECSENTREAAEMLLEESNSRCPVDTGALQSSGKVTHDFDNNYNVEYENDYAVYVHEAVDRNYQTGEAKFLENALKYLEDELIKKIGEGFE